MSSSDESDAEEEAVESGEADKPTKSVKLEDEDSEEDEGIISRIRRFFSGKE